MDFSKITEQPTNLNTWKADGCVWGGKVEVLRNCTGGRRLSLYLRNNGSSTLDVFNFGRLSQLCGVLP